MQSLQYVRLIFGLISSYVAIRYVQELPAYTHKKTAQRPRDVCRLIVGKEII